MSRNPRLDGLRIPSEASASAPPRPLAPTQDAVRELVRASRGLRVTLHVPLPERPGFDEVRGFRKVYERAAEEAARRMAELGVAAAQAERAAARLKELRVGLAELPRGTRALAVFLDPEELRAFALTRSARSSVHVGRSFALRPLLAELQHHHAFRLLALSSHEVRLYEGDARELRRIESREVPRSLEEALGTELSEPQLQHRETPKEVPAIFHGHGGGKDERARDRERFHRVLARALGRVWSDRHEPLIVAADPAHGGRFRKVAELAGELEPGIEKNPEPLSEAELHELALERVRARELEEERAALESALGGLARGGALARPEAAARVAAEHRVERVWIEAEGRLARHVDPETGDLVRPLGDEDALDEIAALVLAAGGSARVFERGDLPPGADGEERSPLIAELRGAGTGDGRAASVEERRRGS